MLTCMAWILLGVEAMVIEVERRGSQVVGAAVAENIVEAELKVGSAGIVVAAVAAELGLGIVDVWPQTAEHARESRAHVAKMGQKVFGVEVTVQVDFVEVEVVEEHLEREEQEAWSVVKEELHVDVIVRQIAVVCCLL